MISTKTGSLNLWLHIQIALWTFFASICLEAAVPDDTESKRLEAQLENAMSQGDMNFTAGELTRSWYSRLTNSEAKVERKLSKKERKEFQKSKKRWRSYRAQEVAFHAEFFDEGSIQPLIANNTYALITKHRVAELESLFEDSLSQRDERDHSTKGSLTSRTSDQHEFYFLACLTNASVSFEGQTQMGRGTHQLEVRRLAYTHGAAKEETLTQISCVIYYAGDEYGPTILHTIDECLDPLVRKISDDTVEIYYLAGAHSHFRQRWKLIGYTAELQKEEVIDWVEDPRNRQK